MYMYIWIMYLEDAVIGLEMKMGRLGMCFCVYVYVYESVCMCVWIMSLD